MDVPAPAVSTTSANACAYVNVVVVGVPVIVNVPLNVDDRFAIFTDYPVINPCAASVVIVETEDVRFLLEIVAEIVCVNVVDAISSSVSA